MQQQRNSTNVKNNKRSLSHAQVAEDSLLHGFIQGGLSHNTHLPNTSMNAITAKGNWFNAWRLQPAYINHCVCHGRKRAHGRVRGGGRVD